jgi:hypothetical protein
MSAEAPRRLPAWKYVIAYPFDDKPHAASPEDALSCALALQRIAFLMASGMKGEDIEEDGDQELLAHLSPYGWAWTRRATELLALAAAGKVGAA